MQKSIRRIVFVRELLGHWPILAWLLLIVVAFASYHHSERSFQYVGKVKWKSVTISASENANVFRVFVEPGQRVEAESILVELESSGLRAEEVTLKNELREDFQTREREYYRLRQGLVVNFGHGTTGSDPATTNQNAALASEELEALEAKKSLWIPTDVEEAIETDPRMLSLRSREELLFANAPTSGIVKEVLVSQGQFVVSGQPLVKVVKNDSIKIVAFVPESDRFPPELGETLYVNPVSMDGKWFEATVLNVSPSVVSVNDQISPLPGKVITGRYCYLELLQPVSLADGESATVSRSKPQWFEFL